MLLAPKYLPKLAATVGLFTRYGLREFANRQGLLALPGSDVEEDSALEEDADLPARGGFVGLRDVAAAAAGHDLR